MDFLNDLSSDVSLKELVDSILGNIPLSTKKIKLTCEVNGEGNYYPVGTGKGALITFEFSPEYVATAKLPESGI